MKKIYFFIPISVIITAIICFGISHLNEKKLNEQQEQTENTFFESMNAKVDKEKKVRRRCTAHLRSVYGRL